MSGDLFARYGRWVVHNRWVALLLVLLVSGLAAFGAWQRVHNGLPVDFTPQALFENHSPALTRLRAIEATFGREDNDLVLLLQGPIGTEAGLAALRAVHAAVEATPGVENVDSLVNFQSMEAEDGLLTVRSPLDELPPAEAVAAAAADPFAARLLVSEDGRVVAVRARLDRAVSRVAQLGPLVDAVVGAARAVPLPEGFALSATGVPWVRTEVVAMMTHDELKFVPVIAALFLITTLLLFRRFWVGTAPLVTVLLADVWALGLLLSGGAVLNILSILVPTLVLVVGLSDGIHLVARYREELADCGDRVEAMAATLRTMTVACFLTTFTTAAGFASLAVAETKVIRDFGVHSAIAVMVAWVATMLVLPTLLAFIPVERVGRPQAQSSRSAAALASLDRGVARHPRVVLLATLGLVGITAWLGSGVRTNTHMMEMYTADHPTRRTIELAESKLSGVVPIFIYLKGEPEALLDPAILARMQTLQASLDARPEARWSTSLAQYVAHLHGLLSGEPGLPESRDAVAQELLLAEMSASLPLDLLVDGAHSQARILGMITDAGGRSILDLRDHLQGEADALFAGTGVTPEVTGDGIVASAGLNKLITDLLSSVGLVFVVILGTMWALLRDLRMALLSAIPNVVPLLFTLATLRLIGADIQTTNIVSFTVALGLAVDDTIHFVVRYREEIAAGLSRDEAISATYQGAGVAIVLTTVLLLVGFGTLMSSDLTATRHFGILTGVTLFAALLGDLFLLPALLHRFDRSARAG